MSLIRALRDAVGAAHVLVDDDARAGYETDWTGRFSGRARAVVRPGDADQVAAVVRACADAGAPLVPQGGNTGLVGGGVPRGGEVLVSLRRLDRIGAVDAATPAVTVGAGATLAAVDALLAGHGLEVGVDLAARDSATIGGMVATNAGGIHAVANGSMRHRVIGIQAVLADGRVLDRTAGLVKDNAGYDLPQLLAGSEGTLAVITAVVLRPVPHPPDRSVLLVGCADVAEALEVTAAARRHPGLRAVELVSAAGVAVVARATGVPAPLQGPPWTLLVEHAPAVDADGLAALAGDRPATAALDEADVRRLWHHREGHTEAINALGVPLKLDVTLPPARLADFVARLDDLAPGALVFGHLADGNLHVNLLDVPDGHGPDVEARVLRAVAEHGGSIASEHGIGVAKRDHLHLTRSPVEIDAMRAVKAALDPAGLLNPGVVLGDPGG